MPWTKICNSDIRLLGDAANGVRCASYKEALREAHEFYMDACPDAFIIGQGITEPGGSFGVLDGFVARYGAERILDSPIAENARHRRLHRRGLRRQTPDPGPHAPRFPAHVHGPDRQPRGQVALP